MPKNRNRRDVLTMLCRADVAVEAAAEGQPAKRPTFSMTAYTGGALNVSMWSAPVVLDLSGIKAKARIPILLDHDRGRIVGQASTVEVTSNRIKLAGTITGDNDAANEVVSQARNGFEWEASVGVRASRVEEVAAGAKVVVNGKTFTGPLEVVRAGTLYEVSFVAAGADENSAVKIAASRGNVMDKEFVEWLEAYGFDPSVVEGDPKQRGVLEAAFASSGRKEDLQTGETADPINDVIAEARRIQDIADITARYIDENPARLPEIEAAASKARSDKTITRDAYELSLIRARRPAPEKNTRTGGVRPEHTADVLEAALCLAGGLRNIDKKFPVQTLEAADKAFGRRLGVEQLLVICARANGFDGHRVNDGNMREVLARSSGVVQASGGGVSTIGIGSTLSSPGILSNVANKFLEQGFLHVDQAWRSIASIRPVRDFKTVRTFRLTMNAKHMKVPPGGELKHAEAGELSYSNKADTYGIMFGLGREDIINDDLGALTTVPQELGVGSGEALNERVWTVFLDNAVFFTSGRGNYSSGGGTALSAASLADAETLFMSQTKPNGAPLGVMPSVLLVPTALDVTARTLMASEKLFYTGDTNAIFGDVNIYRGKFKPVSTPYLSNSSFTGYSSTAWYLLADPMVLPVLEVALLNGRDVPIIETSEADFNTLGIQMRAYHDFGVALQEYRGGVKMAGA